ncbi:MAG TPA: TetR/AcrR family transcriptional regulator, partial [Ktedonobacterales bacterium]
TCMNINADQAPSKRRYRMNARAEAAAATRTRILQAAVALFWEQPLLDLPLEVVARRAEVALTTVIRHFGDRQGLLVAAAEHEATRITQQRAEAPVGDLHAAVHILFDHYEELGDAVLRLLAEEERVPGLRVISDIGREVHTRWCEQVFALALASLHGDQRVRRLAGLMAVTDVYVWKLLRRDRKLSRDQAELALCELLDPMMGGT